MKKLLLLGGSAYLLSVIETAHRLGLYVITCDYLPDNIAHRYADEYLNISIIDKEKVLQAAREKNIDGIMSFACDPGVVTAAYVAEQMGLPFQCSYEAAVILQDKGLFRQFLLDHDFASPKARRYTKLVDAIKDEDYFTWPVIVKPVDSAGSKGVSRVDNVNGLGEAVRVAMEYSHSEAFIVEDFLNFEGFHSSTDPFTIEGKLCFATYSDQLFDKSAANPYTPAFIIWPSTMNTTCQEELTLEIQRLADLLGMRTGIYNIETCVANGGKPYIMEVSPRGGGCRIAELQKEAYGVDLIEAEIRKAVGMEVDLPNYKECDGVWCEMVVHAAVGQAGVLKKITIADDIMEKNIIRNGITVKPGDYIREFTGANMSLGDLFIRCDTREELDNLLQNVHDWLVIELE